MRQLSFARRHAGLTLIEFMVSIVIGMLLIAVIATLIASQSQNRGDLDRAGRMIENGRYAVRLIAEDAQMAGYWGELGTLTATSTPPDDPCSEDVSVIQGSMAVHVQGFDGGGVTFPTCLSNRKAGTDVLVIRHADPDTSDVLTAGLVDWTRVKQGQVYLQTGLDSTGLSFSSVFAAAAGCLTNDSSSCADAATFLLKKKDKISFAPPRKVHVHIYYIASCSVESSGACVDSIPTLKRKDLAVAGGVPSFLPAATISEGIENLQVDYGIDSDSDGAPDGSDVDGSTLTTAASWSNVMSLKVYVLARANDETAGFTDSKKYAMGTFGTTAAANDKYQRHVFVQSVRLVNPAGRRAG